MARDGSKVVVDPVSGPQVLAAPEFMVLYEHLDELASAVAPLQGQVSKDPKTAAVILAGGAGERFGQAGGKQLVELLGKPLLTWAAEAFDAVADVGLIVIVCPEDRMDEYLKVAIDPYPFVTRTRQTGKDFLLLSKKRRTRPQMSLQ